MSEERPILRVIEEIRNGIRHKKCRKCGCQQGTVRAIEEALNGLSVEDRALLTPVIEEAKSTFQQKEYDCLGCKVCFPAEAINELIKIYPDLTIEAAEDSCRSGDIDARKRKGWPPLPGNIKVLRYQAPVAVCTLNSKDLIPQIAETRQDSISIVGSLSTENLGIEHVVKNIISNPNIRFLIVCGEDSRQKVGHLPGQSIVSLSKNGIDGNRRIIGAEGRRPVLKNISPDSIDSFRRQVEHVDMIGCSNSSEILKEARTRALKSPGVFSGGAAMKIEVPRIEAKPPKPLQIDPKGYFVIYPDPERNHIVVEHYNNDGALDSVIEGKDITYIYMTAVEMGLLSRLDHACYLGKELERAADSLRTGKPYEQDLAQDSPEAVTDAKTPSCKKSVCR